MMEHELNEHNMLEYITAGKAIITGTADTTGNRYTYKVTKATTQRLYINDIWFVDLLVGAYNESDYAYIGCFYSDYALRITRASKMHQDSAPIVAFKFMMINAVNHKLHNKLHVYRPNKCGRCGRTLTTPESIISGFGPECRNRY